MHWRNSFIEKQAEDPSLSREGMNAVRFPFIYDPVDYGIIGLAFSANCL
jgi:hypothetical protein